MVIPPAFFFQMRALRNKIEEIWDFEAKVERNLAVVSLSMNEIEETLTYLEKNAVDPDDFFRKNARRISPEDRYRANWLVNLFVGFRDLCRLIFWLLQLQDTGYAVPGSTNRFGRY